MTMTQTKNQVFESMLKDRAKRLNISIQEAARVGDNDKPLSLLAAEERARLEGTTADVVLQHYYDRLKDPSYPTPECLTADEVAELEDLPTERQAHLLTCAPCKALSTVTQPSEEGLAKLLKTVRQKSSERKQEKTNSAFEKRLAKPHTSFSVANLAAFITRLVRP
jgi:hypothetical protein